MRAPSRLLRTLLVCDQIPCGIPCRHSSFTLIVDSPGRVVKNSPVMSTRGIPRNNDVKQRCWGGKCLEAWRGPCAERNVCESSTARASQSENVAASLTCETSRAHKIRPRCMEAGDFPWDESPMGAADLPEEEEDDVMAAVAAQDAVPVAAQDAPARDEFGLTEQDDGLTAAQNNSTALDEPLHLCCPITHMLFRDPVFVPEAGTSYERSAIEEFWLQSGSLRDPLSNSVLSSDASFPNFDKRREVAAWLAEHPEYVPQGWESRDDIPPARTHGEREEPEWQGGAGRGAPGLQAFLHERILGRRRARGHHDARGDGRLNPQRSRQIVAVLLIVVALAVGLDAHHLLLLDEDAMAPPGGSPAGRDRPACRSTLTTLTGPAAELPPSIARRAPPKGTRLRVDVVEAHAAEAHADPLEAHETPPPRDAPLMRPGIQLRLPSAALSELLNGQTAMGMLFLGFTWMWTSQAWAGGAPMPFLAFSAPFWFAGAAMLKSSLLPVFESYALTIWPDGLQIESARNLFGGSGGGVSASDATSGISTASCTFLPFRALEDADHAVSIQATMVINGVEFGQLSIHDGMKVHPWGQLLRMPELRYVRDLIVDARTSSPWKTISSQAGR